MSAYIRNCAIFPTRLPEWELLAELLWFYLWPTRSDKCRNFITWVSCLQPYPLSYTTKRTINWLLTFMACIFQIHFLSSVPSQPPTDQPTNRLIHYRSSIYFSSLALVNSFDDREFEALTHTHTYTKLRHLFGLSCSRCSTDTTSVDRYFPT